MSKTIVTLVGKDHTGIIAAVCQYFADNDINIMDITQTIVEEYISMMMVVDVDKYTGTFPELTKDLENVGRSVGCSIKAQHEDIFNMMHRI